MPSQYYWQYDAAGCKSAKNFATPGRRCLKIVTASSMNYPAVRMAFDIDFLVPARTVPGESIEARRSITDFRTLKCPAMMDTTIPMGDETDLTRRRVLGTGTALVLSGLAGCGQSGQPESTATPQATDAPPETPTDTPPQTDTPADTETATATPVRDVETLVSIPGEQVPENLAFDANGNLYFGLTVGGIRRVGADQTSATGLTLSDTEQLATLPGAIGVETAPDGTVYVAVTTQDDRSGVWEVPPDGDPSQLVAISGFPNDILFDADRDRLLVTESQNGLVYAVGSDGSHTTWLDHDRLDTESFGANGLTRDSQGNIYVAVTRAADQTGRLIRVPVASDGGAGEASTFFEGEAIFGADGITARGDDIYVAANSQNRVVRVTPDGTGTSIATEDDGLVFPSDVLFGSGAMNSALFICNFANQSPKDGAILRTRI